MADSTRERGYIVAKLVGGMIPKYPQVLGTVEACCPYHARLQAIAVWGSEQVGVLDQTLNGVLYLEAFQRELRADAHGRETLAHFTEARDVRRRNTGTEEG